MKQRDVPLPTQIKSNNDIALHIKTARKRLQMTQSECANFLGININTYRSIEKGGNVQLSTILATLNGLGVKIGVIEE